MPKGLGEVSIPNPYQKGKGQTHLELQVFHKYIFNSITKNETKDPAELLPQLFIPFNLSTTVLNSA